MYFFSDEERKYLLKKLIPKSREESVAEELRGWQWHNSELSPPHDIILPLWEVANRYCETRRDVYLRHVENVKVPPSEEMVAGAIYHSAIAELYPTAKRLIYKNGLGICSELGDLLNQRLPEAVMEAEENLLSARANKEPDGGIELQKSVHEVVVNLYVFSSFQFCG